MVRDPLPGLGLTGGFGGGNGEREPEGGFSPFWHVGGGVALLNDTIASLCSYPTCTDLTIETHNIGHT